MPLLITGVLRCHLMSFFHLNNFQMDRSHLMSFRRPTGAILLQFCLQIASFWSKTCQNCVLRTNHLQ